MLLPPAAINDKWFFTASYSRSQLRQFAVALYVLYRTTNHIRHAGHTTEQYRIHYMNQMLHEATRGDTKCRRDLDAARARVFTRRRPRDPDDRAEARRVVRRRGSPGRP